MSLVLQPMSEAEYAAFYQTSLEHHVEELIRKENMPPEEAEAETKAELAEMLPEGLSTPDNCLFQVLAEDTGVGYLWFLTELTEGVKQLFLCDFTIDPPFRGKGYARAALAEMEKLALELECKECVLFVENENKAAESLYFQCGYQVQQAHSYGNYMVKILP